MDTTFERIKSREEITLFGIKKIEGKDEWLTPPHIIKSLGEFDLDPCAPIKRPWDIAKNHFSIIEDGLKQKWFGRVWLNPPYGGEPAKWMRKLAEHNNGIALLFARTDTSYFFDFVWQSANTIFFFKKRLKFYHVSGKEGGSSGAPSCLIAYGDENKEAIRNSGLIGKLIVLK
jgi:hypothetical protein